MCHETNRLCLHLQWFMGINGVGWMDVFCALCKASTPIDGLDSYLFLDFFHFS